MDRGFYTASILSMVLGITGIWFSYFSGLAETLREMSGISILILLLGIALLPVGLFKGGLPNIRDAIPLASAILG